MTAVWTCLNTFLSLVTDLSRWPMARVIARTRSINPEDPSGHRIFTLETNWPPSVLRVVVDNGRLGWM